MTGDAHVTPVTPDAPDAPDALSPREAIARAAVGELIAYPTETSWGLGANARSPRALELLRAAKGRAQDKPISVLVESAESLAELGARLEGAARSLARAFWPGPLTLVLPAATLARALGGRGDGVGFRCSPHPVARELAALAHAQGIGPLTATSLNRAGEPAANTRAEAERCAARELPLLASERGLPLTPGTAPRARRVPLVAGPDAGAGAPSTVVDATLARPRVLREGAIAREDIARALRRGALR